MPNSAALVAAISTISASTNTCARRASSFSITPRSALYTASGAMITSELVSGYAWIEASPSAPVGGAPAGGAAGGCRKRRRAGRRRAAAAAGRLCPARRLAETRGGAARARVGCPVMIARSASANRVGLRRS